MGTTHQAITYRTLLDPPDSQTKRAFQISSKQANKQQTKPSQHTKPPAKANNPPSADGQTHPLYYSLHLPIKQKWVSCGLKALAESTQAAELSSTSTAPAGLPSGSPSRASTASSKPPASLLLM